MQIYIDSKLFIMFQKPKESSCTLLSSLLIARSVLCSRSFASIREYSETRKWIPIELKDDIDLIISNTFLSCAIENKFYLPLNEINPEGCVTHKRRF